MVTHFTYYYDSDHKLAGVDKTGTTNDIILYYDDNGNLTQKNFLGQYVDDMNYVYDYENRLVEYTSGYFDEEYFTYDGQGNRIERNNGSSTYEQMNDISGELPRTIAEGDSGGIDEWFIHGLGPISFGSSTTSGRSYIFEDAINNIRYKTTYTGSGASNIEYEAYGIRTDGSGTLPPYRFHGQRITEDSALYYMNARYYDPEINRFISRDPISGSLTNPQSQNPYSYALNNPINYSDPSGLAVDGICLGGSVSAGLYLGCSVCIAYSWEEKKLGVLTSKDVGASSGASASVNAGFVHSNANKLSDLSEPAGTYGISGGEFVDVGLDQSFSINNPLIQSTTLSVGGGFNVSPPGLPAEIHGGFSY